MKKHAKIIGTGSSVGDLIVTNKDLEKIYDTTDEWIQTNIGIKTRRFAKEGQSTSDMAAVAGQNALDMAGLKASDIDLIILATNTPDHTFPNSSLLVKRKLNADKAAVFDMKAQCSGFVHLLAVGAQMALGHFKNVMVIASEVIKPMLDPKDRMSNCLFGDGASAVILTEGNNESGVMAYHLDADPMFYENAYVPKGGSAEPFNRDSFINGDHYIQYRMSSSKGKKTDNIMSDKAKEWDFVKSALILTLNKSLSIIGKEAKDLDFLLPHPGNMRTLNLVLNELNIPREKSHVTFDKFGNTSGPQIGISMDEAFRKNLIKKGDLVGMNAIGMGMQWGSLIFKSSI